VVGEVEHQVLGRLELNRAAEHRLLVAAQPLVAALAEADVGEGVGVVPGAVELGIVGADANTKLLRDHGAGDRHGAVVTLAVAGGDRGIDAPVLGRLPGDVVDRTHEGVAPVAGALRPLHHLDALDVAEAEAGEVAARQVDAVEEERHVLLEARTGDLVGATDHGRRGAAPAEIVEAEPGREPGDVPHVLDVAARHVGGGERGDRQRDLLQRFLAASGRDHDFLQATGLRLVSGLGAAQGRRGGGDGGEQDGGTRQTRHEGTPGGWNDSATVTGGQALPASGD
jgi:hypothetical protein